MYLKEVREIYLLVEVKLIFVKFGFIYYLYFFMFRGKYVS